jgi:hypothetical protein
MRPEEGVVRKVRRRDQVARLEAEIDELRPYLELAREIRAEVDRVAADPSADALADAIDAVPVRERRAVALAVFRQLPLDAQWAVLERAFQDDGELRELLAGERDRAAERLSRDARRSALVSGSSFDTRAVLPGEQLTLGLFRERDVRDAVALGHRSTTCARRLVLASAAAEGLLRVIEDVFNPSGGYFVTDDYDRDTWAAIDRLPPHAIVRVGAITSSPDGSSFDPVLHLGARLDVERDGTAVEGRLHVGFVMVGDVDVFAEGG